MKKVIEKLRRLSKGAQNECVAAAYNHAADLAEAFYSNAAKDAAKNEPNPKPGRLFVLPYVIQDLEARSEMGEKKYGTALKTENGRNALMDAYQEALDLAMYLKQALLEAEESQNLDFCNLDLGIGKNEKTGPCLICERLVCKHEIR